MLTQIDYPGADPTSDGGTIVSDINSSGSSVGTYSKSSVFHSFERKADGTFTSFDPPTAGTAGSTAVAVNTNGTIVGMFRDAQSARHGYIRNLDGTFTTVDAPDAAQIGNSPGTNIVRVSDSGVIAGFYFDASGVKHGYVRK